MTRIQKILNACFISRWPTLEWMRKTYVLKFTFSSSVSCQFEKCNWASVQKGTSIIIWLWLQCTIVKESWLPTKCILSQRFTMFTSGLYSIIFWKKYRVALCWNSRCNWVPRHIYFLPYTAYMYIVNYHYLHRDFTNIKVMLEF